MYHTKRDCVNNLRPNLRQQARGGEGDENLTVADVEIEGGGGGRFQSDVSKNSNSDFLYTIKILILRSL